MIFLAGTNRANILDEIRDAKNHIPDVETLKQRLALLAEGEEVFWIKPLKQLELPPGPIRRPIVEYTQKIKLLIGD